MLTKEQYLKQCAGRQTRRIKRAKPPSPPDSRRDLRERLGASWIIYTNGQREVTLAITIFPA